MKVLRWICPKRTKLAFSSPGIIRSTRFCSPHFMRDWKPTRLNWLFARFSCRSWTTAQGRRPSGVRRPTGFIGPKRRVSTPRRAISSMGRHPSKKTAFSNSCGTTTSAPVTAAWKARYCSSFIGALR